MINVIELVLEIIVVAGIILGSTLVTIVNLYYKDVIWVDIYERMGWNETLLCIQTHKQDKQ